MLKTEWLCLWNNRALFMGYLPEFGMRRQGAAALCFGLDREIEVSTDNQNWIRCRSALTTPLIDHAIRFSGGYCALLFIDAQASDFRALAAANASKEQNGIFTALQEESQLLDSLARIRLARPTAEVGRLLKELELGGEPQQVGDTRLQAVMQHILSDLTKNTPAEELAQLAQMSVSNLEHMFRHQVGVPLRMFRLWFRLKAVALAVSQGKSLTDAALAAGFFDSAHFTRSFKETFGLPPSEIFSPKRQLQWFVESDTVKY